MNNKNMLTLFAKYVTANVLGMIGLSCYILADTFFIARGVGPDGLTALNLAIPIYSIVHGSGLMFGMGGATRYSLSTDNDSRKKTVFTQAFYMIMILSLLLVVSGLFFSEQIASFLGADENVLIMTSTYLKVILIFAPMFMLNNLVLCFVRNDGEPRLAMGGMLLGSFSNIILDYIFVFPLDLGIFGAALATGIAPIISLLVMSMHFIKKKNGFWFTNTAFHIKSIIDIGFLGLSSLITELSSGIVIVVFNILILKLEGNLGVAAYSIIANLSLVVISIFTGIAQGVQPILSDSYGRGNVSDAKKVLSFSLITSLILACIIYIGACIFAHPIVGLFNKDSNVWLANIAVYGIYIYFTAFFFVGINIILSMFFSSIEKPKESFLISILRGFIAIIPIAILLSNLFGMTGVWLALPITEFFVCIVGAVSYLSKGFSITSS